MTGGSAASFSWSWRRFADLSGGEVYDVLALRAAVFVVEQRCVFADVDGADRDAWHLLGRAAASGRVGAYLRCLDPGVRDVDPSIGRVVVDPALRGAGSGRFLMSEGIARTRRAWPSRSIMIGAQRRLEAFYASLGFVPEGMPYDEDGIEHVQMRLPAHDETGDRR